MKAVVLLSGGLDSTVCTAALVAAGHTVRALSVHYGQRHSRELESARAVARHYGIAHETAAIPAELVGGSALTGGGPVPHGHYEDESMRATVVPNRNMILLAYAAAVAVREGFDAVAYTAHAGDHAVYPDCRPAFADAMRAALAVCHYEPVRLVAPFVGKTKAQIVSDGILLRAPLTLTWSCYEGGARPCGRCGTCVERAEAFRLAGETDPAA